MRTRRLASDRNEVKRDVIPASLSRKPHPATADAIPPRSLLLALFLSLGVLSGYAVSARCGVGNDELRAYFDGCAARAAASAPDLETALRTAVCYFRASVAAFLLGFSPLGVVCLPLLLAAQGFVLSFSLFSFAEALGHSGFPLLAALFSLRLLFVLPCTFLLGSASMERAWSLSSLLRGKRVRPVSAGLYRFAVCCACLLLGCVLELWLVPLLLQAM